ncbi:MAG: hypothetical protein ACOYU3_07485 [Bacillota bacterium]
MGTGVGAFVGVGAIVGIGVGSGVGVGVTTIGVSVGDMVAVDVLALLHATITMAAIKHRNPAMIFFIFLFPSLFIVPPKYIQAMYTSTKTYQFLPKMIKSQEIYLDF